MQEKEINISREKKRVRSRLTKIPHTPSMKSSTWYKRSRTHITVYHGYTVYGHAKLSLINSQKNGFLGKMN